MYGSTAASGRSVSGSTARCRIPQGGQRLREAGNLDDLRLAADGVVDPARFRGPWFMDSDVHKWLEAVAWEQGREPSADLAAEQRAITQVVADAQLDDGYLNSYVQVKLGLDKRFTSCRGATSSTAPDI